MSYRLSILDKSLIPEGADAATALRNTLALAVRAEELNYHRYWFAEHHGVVQLASSAPEVLASFVLARTKRIRVGSGGVMLRHYAPYKVAEAFNTLAALAPGRVDLGVGKAPGGLPPSTRALRSGRGIGPDPDFDTQLEELDGFLSGVLPEAHPLADVVLSPRPPSGPERILLGASIDSAELAGRLGWQFCYAGQFDGNPEHVTRAFDAYRLSGGVNPLLAVVAFASETREEAARRVGALRLYNVRLDNGQTVNVPSLEFAAEYARQAGAADYTLEEMRPSVVYGTAEEVHEELEALQRRYGVEEFVIDSPVADFAARLASVELIAVGAAVAAA
jgi:luciferase family oxidoreductase group 1